jgi:transposase-like protein
VKKARKHYAAEEKVAILGRHLLEQEPVSKLCDELGLQPTVFCRWQKVTCSPKLFRLSVKWRAGVLR